MAKHHPTTTERTGSLNLYTMKLDYRGGTYISQIMASDEVHAARQWINTVDTKPIKYLGEKFRSRCLAYFEDDHGIVSLAGIQNVWLAHTDLYGQMGWLHIIKTEKI